MSEIQKGDRVRITENGRHHGREGTVLAAGLYLIHVIGDVNVTTFHKDNFVVLPPDDEPPAEPEPTHHVLYEKDELRLQEFHNDAEDFAIDSVPMFSPSAVELKLVEWGDEYDVDVDEVRKTIAEPRVLDRVDLTDGMRCVAARHANGWFATKWSASGDTDQCAVKHGVQLTERAARLLFPDIKGPYVERPTTGG